MSLINKKYIKFCKAGVICFMFLGVSCSDDFLDVPPQGQEPSQEFFKSQDDAMRAVNAIYANFREWRQVAYAPIAIETIPSDDDEKRSSP
jgi:starch-binding outer membrane protein, SusD/RagB family